MAYATLFTLFFLALVAALGGSGMLVVRNWLEQRLVLETNNFDRMGRDLGKTIQALNTRIVAEPCSASYLQWLRRIAFLPDGIHEIIYAPGGQMHCSVSVSSIEPPARLGTPDFVLSSDKGRIWLDRDLSILGYPGVIGTFLMVGDFILVLPSPSLAAPIEDTIDFETVYRDADGQVWHLLGVHDLFSAVTGSTTAQPWNVPVTTGFTTSGCDATKATCIALSAPVAPLLRKNFAGIVGALLLAALIAAVGTHFLCRRLERFWSLTTRFRHLLSDETVVCHYQPLFDLQADRIAGIEVLARWRDDDDTLVYPDTFIPIVEKKGLHRTFTRHIVDRAYRELSRFPVGEVPLMVHFNIFPFEFDPAWMLELFEDFLADRSRFTVVIELVESDALPIESTRIAIDRLKEAGILTYIDDFGAGYSSIGYLAGLGTYGVKLDRSFGLAPEGSLMDAMLSSAIDMVAKTGQVLVVEGVETAGRLASLKANANVAMAQGYFISRPVDVEALETMLRVSHFWPDAKAA